MEPHPLPAPRKGVVKSNGRSPTPSPWRKPSAGTKESRPTPGEIYKTMLEYDQEENTPSF